MANSFQDSFNVFIQQKKNVLIKTNALGHKNACTHPFMIARHLYTLECSLEVLKAEIRHTKYDCLLVAMYAISC